MAKKIPNEVEQLIEAKITEALREYTTEHVADLKVMQEGFELIQKEVEDLRERLNTLAERLTQHLEAEGQ
ncbi:MAG: hypothetical protein LUP95_03255 [Euryarchaeota archaeon]|nr:hypothetical protein [Euryarchaeota archaeon]